MGVCSCECPFFFLFSRKTSKYVKKVIFDKNLAQNFKVLVQKLKLAQVFKCLAKNFKFLVHIFNF